MMKRIYLILLAVMIAAGAAAHAVAAEAIDVNAADVDALTALNGIGPARAEAIVEHRRNHGPFRSLEEIADVRGVSLNLVDRNRDRIVIGNEAAADDPPEEE